MAPHAHRHDHHHHHHGVSADADTRKLTIALVLILAFMVVEVVAGLLASSLALLSDAGHMLTDAAALGLSLVAIRLAARPPTGVMTYGLKRVEPLSALVNGVTLLLLGLWFTIEGVRRLADPPDVEGGIVLAAALAGIPVNLLATWVLSKANRRSLNVEGAFQHLLTDLYAFIATAAAAAVILTTGFDEADALAALLVAALMLRAAGGLLHGAGRVFLEAAPAGVDPQEVGHALASQRGVSQVHDLHVWELTSGFPALSAHVLVARGCDGPALRRRLEHVLAERFAITHTTLQLEHEPPALLSIEPASAPPQRSG